MKRYLDTDPLSGAVSVFEYDESTGNHYVHRHADVTPIIEKNKEAQNHTDGVTPEGFWEVADIPQDVLYLWLTKYGVRAWDKNHWPKVRQLLNSNEWRYLRVKHCII